VTSIAVVTDSTADFPVETPAELGITVVPLTVNWGRDILRDGIDITTEEFYVRLRMDAELPKTAAPPIGIFEEVYRNLLTVHDAVISVHIASALSATYGVAASAARSVDAARVHVVDSTSVSIGTGWLADRAARLAQGGESADPILRTLKDMVPRLRIYVTLETLEYLQRGGRIGRAQAFLGGLLNVKPVLEVRDGEVRPIERVRTRAASIRRVAELIERAGSLEEIGIVHGACLDEAQQLRTEIERRMGRAAIPVTELGPVIGTHAGPGVIGAGCLVGG
jgi:DegV family protein with EDD domain